MSARSAPGFFLEENSESVDEQRGVTTVRERVVVMPDADESVYVENRASRECIAFVWTLAQFLWAMFLFSVAVWKIVENSLFDYISHFTNISWTLQIFFYFATAFGPLLIAWRLRPPLRFVILVIAIMLMPLFGLVVAVVIVIFILIGTDAGTITQAFAQYPPEIVIIGNDFYHVVPVIALLIYIALERNLIFYSLNLGLQWVAIVDELSEKRIIINRNGDTAVVVHRTVERRRVRHVSIALFLYQAYIGSLIPILFYVAVFNPRTIYGTSMTFLEGFGILIASLTVSNALPLALAIYGWRLGTRALTIDNYLFK